MNAKSIHHSIADDFCLKERWYSHNNEKFSIGIANISAHVPDIDANKEKIISIIKLFKEKKVNMILFPEFCLGGYFWEDETACWEYMDQVVLDNHLDWIRNLIEPEFDDTLKYVVLNNIRKNTAGGKKHLNTTFVIQPGFDINNVNCTYNKTFLPSIENTYTVSGVDDRLALETPWGRLGFYTCYDLCFPQLLLDGTLSDEPDAIIAISSWRSGSERNYPAMKVKTDNYYGFLYNTLMPAMAAVNQSWIISCNAVGTHPISNVQFGGGSGIWAPSGLKMIQGSHNNDELIIVHNIDLMKARQFEKDDFDYSKDFKKIHKTIDDIRGFTWVCDEKK
jgi:predicted amidohydrolase